MTGITLTLTQICAVCTLSTAGLNLYGNGPQKCLIYSMHIRHFKSEVINWEGIKW